MSERFRLQYFTYIMASRSGTLYLGPTSEFYVRVLQHKNGEIEGFSHRYKCNRLVYYESDDDPNKAVARKGSSRAGGAPRKSH